MACREYLMWHQDLSYGTAALSGGAPATGKYHYIRLDTGNAFDMRGRRITSTIPYGGGFNVPYLRVGKAANVAGTLKTILYYSQASNLLGWALTRVNSGRTTPWTTTDASSVMPPGDLASATIYHAYMLPDGTFARRAYRGVKVASLRLECSADSPLVVATFGLVAQKHDPNSDMGGSDSAAIGTTEFPGPTNSSWPSDPVLFQESTGLLKIGSTRTQYQDLSIEVTNNLNPLRYESRFLQTCRMTGRAGMLTANMRLKGTPDNRAAFDALTAQDTEVSWTNGSNTVKIDLNTAAIIDDVTDDLPIEGEYNQRLSVASFWDGANAGDIVFTYT